MFEGFYKSILDHLNDAVYFVDANRVITYWNKAAEQLTGFSADEVMGRSCQDNVLIHVDDEGTPLCLTHCPLADSIQSGSSHESHVYMHHKKGHRLPVRVHTTPLFDGEGTVLGGVEVFSDNRESLATVHRLKELEGLAYFDTLTAMPNRRLLNISLENLQRDFETNSWPFGVLMLDIDHFKKVNDTYGHQIGDEVLKMVGRTLLANSRQKDVVGRWGGEEFLAAVGFADLQSLHVVAEKYRMLIEHSRVPEEFGNFSVTVSIGGAIAQNGESLEQLIARADQQLYLSKENGRNRVTLA